MARCDKLLAQMRANPANDWTMADVVTLCNGYGIRCAPPRRGDHFKISHASQVEMLTVPAHRPIKAVYVRKLVNFVEAVISSAR